ncbi:hypothetical protein [Lignipirellula cremea]|uniref:Uncharacterized protein n=1 Tax=Lignipirellula cremea TaxID=2528010 RepID=A0A518DVC6_9BACT|nr:hypothetical protein [Lignipirellula cremea]QDU95789.1 hypothetical protein Pla8534_36060 [Lignipirellula cremea]
MYSSLVEGHMRELYASLSEKDRRRYAAVEAEKLGHGGVKYIADLFGCHEDTIRRGQQDVERLPDDEAAGRVRVKGGDEVLLALQSSVWSPPWKRSSSSIRPDRR